jgi:hypothetical protein
VTRARYQRFVTEGAYSHFAAVFDGKRLVLVSSCELHPKYQALRPPRSKKAGCTCAEIYTRRNAVANS